ncbi:metal-dependent phosphohydrolase [Streptomyces sp. NA04227]|uniref:metal-dependent phosphohydrolase n=1 Tax=Streptomyces sp. NA04227 TaxID=2742136 RepID=UPI00158FDFFA|nr:metal-dependent phosphohydrolase [Streptomyces sp. NA04227]QKW10317.1 metal-dependent phosphohydrolase [Streptomyces sp. NA04227]
MELRTVDELMDLLRACRGVRGTPDHGGALGPDLHEHALQTAALLRRGHPSDKELQVAGLVHGIGRALRPGDDVGHAGRAADAVRRLLGERVSQIVRLHIAAKRYLAATEPGHWLSAQHRLTLSRQGGPMPERERAAFARAPFAEEALILRQADDAARTTGMDAGVLEDWHQVIELVAARQPARPLRAYG